MNDKTIAKLKQQSDIIIHVLVRVAKIEEKNDSIKTDKGVKQNEISSIACENEHKMV